MNGLNGLAAVIVLSALGTGCASITKGNDQQILVDTVGCEGEISCTVKNKDNDHVTKPGRSVSVEKGRQNLTIYCESQDRTATGMVIVESKYEAMNAGNIILGGVIGVGIDAATGAMWKFPETVTVPMTCVK
jgi:hypothetical protein